MGQVYSGQSAFNSHEEAIEHYRRDAEARARAYGSAFKNADGSFSYDDSIYNGIDPDAWYYDAIAKYKGTSYYDYLLSNPHLTWRNNAFAPSFGQALGEAFGDYSGRNQYYESLRSNANNFLSDFLNQRNQQSYDSAASQVERERAAGINPDISGGEGITPGMAAENDQPFANPSYPSGPGVVEIAESGISFVTSVFSMVQGIQGMIGNQGVIAAQDIANHASAMDFVQSELLNGLSSNDISDPEKIDTGVILNILDSLAGDSSFHSSTRKVIKRYRNEVFQNSGKMATLRQELAQRYINSRKGVAEGLADPYYEKKLTDWVGRVAEFFRRLNAAVVREFDARESKAIYEDTKYSAADGNLEGAAMNEEALARGKAAKREGTAAENEESALEVYNELVKFLQEDDSIWSKFGLFFLPKLNNLLDTLTNGAFKVKFDSSDRSRHQTVNGGPTYKTGPTVINN